MNKFLQFLKPGIAATVLLAAAFQAQAAIPTVQGIAGDYTLTSADFTLENQSTMYDFESTFTFSISVSDSGIPSIVGFFGEDTFATLPASYNDATGVLTFTNSYARVGIGYYGFAPNGVWGGYTGTDKMTITFGDDGSISIPDFWIEEVSGNNVTTVFAKYVNNTVTAGSSDGSDEEGSYEPIEGNWNIVYTDKLSGTTPNYNYEITLKGNTVYFTQIGDNNVEGEYSFIGTLDGNTITFEKQIVARSAYPEYQIPFTSAGDGSFTATFNDSEEPYTITFPAGAGFKFQNQDTSTGQVMEDKGGLTITSATKISDFASKLKLTLDNGATTSSGSTIIAVFNYTSSNLDMSLISSWKASVNLVTDQDDDGNNVTEEVTGCTVTADTENKTFTINIPDQAEGKSTYEITVSGYGADENEPLVTSAKVAVTLTVGAALEVIQPYANVEGFTITLGARVFDINAIPEGSTYKIKYAPYTDVYPSDGSDPDYDTNAQYATATLSNGYISGDITVDAPGSYNYAFAFGAYTSTDELIILSNWNSQVAVVADPTLPAITISDATGYINDDNSYVISFSVELDNIEDGDVAYYVANFSYADHSAGGAASKSQEVEVDHGYVTATLTDMPEGNYSINIDLVAYDSDNQEIATSNELVLSNISTAINSIGSEAGDVRYFNLNGIEIARPDKGIYIRVENGKATKVVR